MIVLSDEVAFAAAQGDPAAMRTVYDTLAPAVLGYFRTSGSSDPEGLSQEVFLTVFARLGGLTGGAAGLRSLTFTVAHARLVDELRARSRRPLMEPLEASDEHRTTESAESSAIRNQSALEALRLLTRLGDAQRDVLALRLVACLSLQETAAVTGRSVGAVKQLQRRALIALRSVAQQEGVTPAGDRR